MRLIDEGNDETEAPEEEFSLHFGSYYVKPRIGSINFPPDLGKGR
jgi:hypothetical protein